jgi:hypothetical protein
MELGGLEPPTSWVRCAAEELLKTTDFEDIYL